MKFSHLLLAAAATFVAAASATAATQYWDPSGTAATTGASGGTGAWNTTNLNWSNLLGIGGVDAVWLTGNTAAFGVTTGAVTVTVTGTQTVGGLSFGTDGYTLTGGTLTFDNGGSAATIDVSNASTAVISSAFNAGTAGLNKTGAGTLRISGTYSGSGQFDVQGGTVILNSFNASNSFMGSYKIETGATLQVSTGANVGGLFNTSNTTGTVTLAGGTLFFNRGTTGTSLLNGVSGSGLVKINGGDGSQSGPAGFTQSGNGIFSGSLAVQVTANPVTFSLANTYTGGTSVTGGTLTIAATTGSIMVGHAGVTVTGSASLVVNGTLKLSATNATITNSSTVTGAITFGSGSSILVGDELDGITGNTYTLITSTAGSIVNNGVTVDVTGSSVWQSASFDNGVLTFTAVPEPSTYGLIGAGALAAVAFVRRRKKNA